MVGMSTVPRVVVPGYPLHVTQRGKPEGCEPDRSKETRRGARVPPARTYSNSQ